jgi:hypothetical protein
MKLFKLFTLGAFMIGAATASYAQDEASNANSMDISFGVKGGVNFATLNGDNIESPNSRTSFHVGLLAEFPLADIFSIQVEALYSGQGAEYDQTITVPDITSPTGFTTFEQNTELQLDYINVPVLAKFYIVEGLSLEAGPQFSFLVNDEWDTNPTADEGDSPSPIRQTANTFEFGVSGGLTFLTNVGLFATARYNQGISDIADDLKVNNSVIQVGLGYKF